MVFESTLSAVLNKFLGDFVENLDGKQLSVGIWGGDVELRDLIIKPSALDDLDLPIQTVYGSIGKLVLKIPWKSLYTSPWIIEVDNILLLAAPNQQVKYDPIKEEKKHLEAKQKELQTIEEAKKAEAEKGKPKADATFVEKLVTTVIKNLQLKVTNIHIRYEDKITNPDAPFACGISLHTLLIESTDANWKKAITDDMVKIYKIVGLEALAVYWNCNAKVYGDESTVSMTTFLKQNISSKENVLANFNYVLGPINASARLRMNQKPESDPTPYTIPKMQLNLDMEKLFIGISKSQYRDIIALTDTLGRMSRGVPYRKYRPNLTQYRGHYKEWWHFAYKCTLEEVVRRRRKNWDWEHILNYRNKCRQYSTLYKKNLKKAIKGEEKQQLDECEKLLDVTSIVIIRQQMEMELQRLLATEAKQDKGWFGWMWKSSAQQDESSQSAALLKQFESEMTPAEKEKLYKAIGYQENAAPATFPKAFVANSVAFLLRSLVIELSDDHSDVKTVLFTDLSGVGIKLEHRPAANAIKAHVKIDDFTTEGLCQDDFTPKLITSETDTKTGLLEIGFETNPLDESCDQRIRVVANPIKVIYDARTINKVIDIFKVPSDTVVDQIQAAAGSGLSNVKEMTSTGLQFAIEKHVRMDVYVDLQAPYVIIPYGGKYTGVENVLVVNLGRLKVVSSGERANVASVRKMYEKGLGHEDIFSRMKQHCYDSFTLELTELQILVAQGDEDWRTAIKESGRSDMHLLSPLSLSIIYSKCLIVDDPRFPQNRVSGELPSIDIRVSEARLMLLAALGGSIPLPEGDVPQSQPLSKEKKGSSLMLLKYKELQQSAILTKQMLPAQTVETDVKDVVQFTTLEAKFVISEISATISQQSEITSERSVLASFKVRNLECSLTQQTFVTNVQLVLSGMVLEQNRFGETIHIINTPATEKGGEYLFKVQFIQVDTKSPELHSKYKSCEACLSLDFGVLNIILHQEGLLSLMEFSNALQEQISEMSIDMNKDRIASTRSLHRQLSSISESAMDLQKTIRSKKKKRSTVVETIKFKLVAELQEVTVNFATDRQNISSCAIRGIVSDIIMKETYTQINANLQEIAIIDLNPTTKHHLIISGTEGTALTTQIVLNNIEGESEKPDMEVAVKMGGMRIVFLNQFVSNMLNFLNQFQEAQQRMIEASQAAAQQAKANMQSAYAKATKIALDINLKAPDIIVPANSKSDLALFLDLGVLSLSNTFITLETKNDEGYSAVLDELRINLSQFQLSRVKLNANGEKMREEELLEPINFDLVVRRNLSASWFDAMPDIYVTGKITTIRLLLSKADYRVIMSILNGNLAEGKVEEVKAEPVKPTVKQSEEVIHVEVGPVCVRHVQEETKVKVFLKFTFTMEQLILNLYTSDGVGDDDMPSHNENSHLAQFSLEGLSVKGRILSDQSIVTSILLVNCLLDDMRKGREDKLNRLIERSRGDGQVGSDTTVNSSVESVANPRSMIDVTYQQKGNDMFADVRVCSFTMILSVDYLMRLAEFFNTGEEQKPDEGKAAQSKSSTTVVKAEPSKSMTVVPPKKPDSESQMTINLKLEKPDIILVEHMDSIDTNAMILNSEIMVKVRLAGAHQVINGAIKDLQLYTCSYNPALREVTRGNVLYPTNISIAGSTPQDKGLHLELLITDIHLSVSPATIELLNRVVVTMTSSGTTEDEDTEEQINHSNLWDQKEYSDSEYWFLKTENALEAYEYSATVSRDAIETKPVLQELCIITVPSIVFTIEAGVGNKTLPMLMLETAFQGAARNWSSQLSLEASLTMEMGYYNSMLALWEPLIEPVEVEKDGKTHFVPWELKVELSMNERDEDQPPTSPTRSDSEAESLPPPVMSIDVVSEHILEMTVTKTCLEVLQTLSKAFASAMEMTSVKHTAVVAAPYKVLNEIGEDVTLLLEESSFKIAEGGSLEDINKSEAVPLQLKWEDPANAVIHLSKELLVQTQKQDKFLHIKVNSKNCELVLPVGRADRRFFMLNYRGEGNDNWGIISDIVVDEGVTIITLRSILRVYNHFSIPIDVYYMTPKGNELELIGAAQPGGYLNIPLKAVYTPTNELFFAVSGHSITSTPYIWKDLQSNVSVTKVLQCPNKDIDKGKAPFIIKCVGQMKQVYFEQTSRHTMASTCYNIHLRPSVIFKNFLPIDVVCCVDEQADEIDVKPGDTLQLLNVDPGRNVLVIRIPEYLEKEWSCRYELEEEPQEFSVWTFNSYDSPTKMSLDLGMHTENKNGSFVMALYCPFWMLNKTGLMIGYRKSKKTAKHEAAGSPIKEADENLNVLHHPAHFKGPILFSFNAKHFFGKKKASIRVESGEWSDKFSLDVAGSSGVITCKANNRTYEIGVHIQFTYNNLTKQVTFTPYYVIINNAPYTIECQENDRPADHWLKVEPKSCAALWPLSELEDKLLRLRVEDTSENSAPFLYTESHNTLLRLNNKFGGVNVDIQITEGAVYINLVPYEPGSAPALLINHTDNPIVFWEKDSVQKRTLEPKRSLLYTWENPSGPRLLVWDKGNQKEIVEDLRKDACGEFSPRHERTTYWASFLDGMQRVLLFTDIKEIAESAEANLFEVIQQEINVAIHGIGISLVNNLTRQEIMYLGIASSGVIWESCRMDGRRYKSLNQKLSVHLENAYQQYLVKQIVEPDQDHSVVNIDGKMTVDFKANLILKPSKKRLRRTFETGLWLQMKSSPNQMHLHAKINRLQIDNQLFDCIFPIVLAPVPPPKSVAIDSGIKPFVEVSIVQLLMKNSQIRQFKYFKVLVQEFHIKVDLGFLNAIFELLQESEQSDEEEKKLFLTDMHLVDEALYTRAAGESLKEQKSFYDLLHFSPLKIHVSFSMAAGTSSTSQNVATPNFLKILLQGIGVTLTDLQDVVFKLAFFERTFTFLTQKQLMSEVTSHYVGQSVKQLYVLVLGLDVIGNPYGLVLGITKGVEDLFYEPFQGAIQGPGEFAEGLALGVKSLFGHTVGGAAGAVSRITGAMGKGIAALTFDEEYQRKRRDQLNKKPATVTEGIARSGKGLVMGVVSGVTGVVTKPVSGAREQGVEGFFKGLGKGAVGLVTRPVAGVVDFASGSLDAVKRCAESGEEVEKLRPSRFLPADGLVRPYNKKEAQGHKLLIELSKGKYARTDIYAAHYVMVQGKEVVLLTDKRIAYICHNDIFGGWQIEWAYTWDELPQPARVVPKGVLITTSEKKKKLFGSSDTTKTLLVGDPDLKEEICVMIESLRGS